MICFIPHRAWRRLALAMILLTQAELLELVEELRSMAVAHPTAKVRDALNQLADRYAARIHGRHEALGQGYRAPGAGTAAPTDLQ
jgi:hypothetical protein